MILTTHPENLVLETFTGKVLQAYWVDVDGNGTTKLPYGDDTIRIFVKTEDAIDKEIIVQVWYNRTGIDSMHKEFSKTITTDEVTYSFLCTPEFFGPNFDSNNIKEFYLYIKIGNGKFRYYSQNQGDRLRVHGIRYLPNIMLNFGWQNAVKTQEDWFNYAQITNQNLVFPKLNYVSMDWIRSFERVNEEFNIISNTHWNNTAAIESLKDEIIKMKNDQLITWPTVSNAEKEFGTFDTDFNNFIQYNGEFMPLIEKYYYQFFGHEIDTNIWGGLEPLDDLFGTLGSFNWHIAAKGKLNYVNANTVKVTIQKIAVYVKDKFEFDDRVHEYLGDWSLVNGGDIFRNPAGVLIESIKNPLPGYMAVHNSDYRNYRDEIGKGNNFNLYSEIVEIDKDFDFNINI